MEFPFLTRFAVAIGAGEPLIRIDADDPQDAIAIASTECLRRRWGVKHWNAADGFCDDTGKAIAAPAGAMMPQAGPPPASQLRATIASIRADLLAEKPAAVELPRVLFVRNLHLALMLGPEPLSTLLELFAVIGEQRRSHLVAVLPPATKLPPGLADQFHTINQPRPDAAELALILEESCAASDEASPVAKQQAASAVIGLTRRQARGAFAASAVINKPLDPDYLWRHKVETVNRDGLVQMIHPDETFDDIGGNAGACELLTQLINGSAGRGSDHRAKGALLFGPAGTGKSMLAKAIGAATRRPTVLIDPGRLKGGLVGDTERNTRALFQLLTVIAPCVAMIDEVGKVMPKYGGSRDNGVSDAMLGSFLTFLSDSKADIFWAYTANEDAMDLHEAFTRSERVDLKFYVGLPGAGDRATIWRIYTRKYFPQYASPTDGIPTDEAATVLAMGMPPLDRQDYVKELGKLLSPAKAAAIEAMLPNDTGWTGAEIKACCRLSVLLGRNLRSTAELISSVAKTGVENIAKLETYAESIGAIDASTGKMYRKNNSIERQPTSRRRATTPVTA